MPSPSDFDACGVVVRSVFTLPHYVVEHNAPIKYRYQYIFRFATKEGYLKFVKAWKRTYLRLGGLIREKKKKLREFRRAFDKKMSCGEKDAAEKLLKDFEQSMTILYMSCYADLESSAAGTIINVFPKGPDRLTLGVMVREKDLANWMLQMRLASKLYAADMWKKQQTPKNS